MITKTVGGGPTASHFSCLAKKSNQKKSPPVCRPFGVPCVARLVRRLRNSRCALRQSSPKSPDQPALPGGAQGMKIQNPRTKTREVGNGRLANTKENVREAHTKPPLTFIPLSAASFRSKRAVGLGEHCLSTWPRSGSCELRSPARLLLSEGTPQGRQTRVAFFLVTFSWRSKKK